MKRYMRVSEVAKAQRCLRTWWLGYKRDGTGLEPANRERGDLRDVGSLVHAGVQAYYRGHNPGAMLREHWLSLTTERDVTDKETQAYELASIMLDGWVKWLASEGADVGEETVLLEERLEMSLGTFRGDEVVLYGTPDRVIRETETGLLVLEDTKTRASIANLDVRLQIDPQMLTYAGMLRATKDLNVTEMRHQLIKRVKRTARATPPFYLRVAVPVTDALLDARWAHLTSTVDSMVDRLQRHEAGTSHHVAFPPTPTGDCAWDCDFLAVCPLMDEGAYWEAALQEMYRPRAVYPEPAVG